MVNFYKVIWRFLLSFSFRLWMDMRLQTKQNGFSVIRHKAPTDSRSTEGGCKWQQKKRETLVWFSLTWLNECPLVLRMLSKYTGNNDDHSFSSSRWLQHGKTVPSMFLIWGQDSLNMLCHCLADTIFRFTGGQHSLSLNCFVCVCRTCWHRYCHSFVCCCLSHLVNW